MEKAIKLPLEPDEKKRLKKAGISLRKVAEMHPLELSDLTGIDRERCKKLVALGQFQKLKSAGLQTALDLWELHYRKITDLVDEEPTEMFHRLEKICGKRLDPCVEDVLRCVVAQAVHPNLPDAYLKWWNWQDQRGKPLALPRGANP